MLRLLINLDHSKDRLTSVTKQINNTKTSFERISAVNGKNLSKEKVDSITYPLNHRPTKVRFTRNLTLGEIGCFLSHRKCWQRLLESKEKWALILEDDILISSIATPYFSTTDWIPNDVKLCQLGDLKPEQRGRITTQIHHIDATLSLVQPRFPAPLGTQAYLISREVATQALLLSEKLPCPVDNFLFSPWFELSRQFSIWKATPPLVIAAPETPSEIGLRKRGSVQKAPFWIRHGLERFLLDRKIKKFQKQGVPITYKFNP